MYKGTGNCHDFIGNRRKIEMFILCYAIIGSIRFKINTLSTRTSLYADSLERQWSFILRSLQLTCAIRPEKIVLYKHYRFFYKNYSIVTDRLIDL